MILITDGEPTAHMEDGSPIPRFSYPPTPAHSRRRSGRCSGRAFFVTPDRLGEYVLIGYVSNKRRRIA